LTIAQGVLATNPWQPTGAEKMAPHIFAHSSIVTMATGKTRYQ
jgi:hypothetical protein